MADPVFDEDYIRELLTVPVNKDNIDAICTGAVQALIDLYDRKVTRDEFRNMAAVAVSLYGQSQKLWMLHAIKSHFDDDGLTAEKFMQADASMCHLIRKQSEAVVEIVKRLQECPTSRDAVH